MDTFVFNPSLRADVLGLCRSHRRDGCAPDAFAYVINRLCGQSLDYMKGSQFHFSRLLFQSTLGDELERIIERYKKITTPSQEAPPCPTQAK